MILLLATFLRVYRLDVAPPALFGDEIDVGYQAYSILKTGQDLYGHTMPILIHSLSEYRAPLFIYSDVPFVAIFGLNEWGVRLAAAFWGILGILGIYLFGKELFNEKIGLLAAFFLTISPWHIQYSRAGFEVTMLLTFLTLGTYFFLKGFDKKYYFIFTGILYALTPYIYSTATVFMPLLVVTLILIYRKQLGKSGKFRVLILTGAIMAIILLPYGYETVAGKSGQRFSIISIFSNKEVQDKVLNDQKDEPLPFDMQKLFHNKPTAYLNQFSINYLRAFSPEFLFIKGDPNPRQSIQEMGEMYFFELAFLLLGVYWLLGKLGGAENKLILSWLLLAPIPASLTYDGGFHATRDFLMLVPLEILVALGLGRLGEIKNRRVLWGIGGILVFVAIFNISFYINRYFIDYPRDSWLAWQYGFKQSMKYVSGNQNSYDKFLINNTYEPSLERFLFWTKYDPSKFHQEFSGDKNIDNVTDQFNGFSLGSKYYFGKLTGPYESLLDNRTLYVASARDDITNPQTLTDSRIQLVQEVNNPALQPIFYLITGIKNP